MLTVIGWWGEREGFDAARAVGGGRIGFITSRR